MMDKVGKEFAGVISGAMSFGVFVELSDIYVEGLVHISTLPDDYYQFDPIRHVLIGERTGRRFGLGDPIKVIVARVDLDKRQIDFQLAEVGMDTKKHKMKKSGKVKKTAKKKNDNNLKNNRDKSINKKINKKPSNKATKRKSAKKN